LRFDGQFENEDGGVGRHEAAEVGDGGSNVLVGLDQTLGASLVLKDDGERGLVVEGTELDTRAGKQASRQASKQAILIGE